MKFNDNKTKVTFKDFIKSIITGLLLIGLLLLVSNYYEAHRRNNLIILGFMSG